MYLLFLSSETLDEKGEVTRNGDYRRYSEKGERFLFILRAFGYFHWLEKSEKAVHLSAKFRLSISGLIDRTEAFMPFSLFG